MKSPALVVVSIAIICVLIPATYAPGYCIGALTYVRHVKVEQNGVLTFNDTVSGFPQNINELSLVFPQVFIENLLDLRVQTDEGVALNVRVQSLENASRLDVLDIPPGASTIILEAVFDNGVWKPYRSGFNVSIPVYPGLNLPVENLYFEMLIPTPLAVTGYPQGFNVTSREGFGRILSFSASNLTSGAVRLEDVSISGLTLLRVERFSKIVTVSEFGDVVVEDLYTVINLGVSTISNMEFKIPLNASEFGARDEFGALRTLSSRGRSYIALTVYPRYSLDKGDRYSFTVFYKFPAGTLVEHSLFKGTHILNLKLEGSMPVVIKTLEVSVRLPEGSTVSDAEPQGYRVAEGASPAVTWVLSQGSNPILSTLRAPPTIRLKYSYNILWASLKPTLWVSLILVAIAAFHGFQRLRGAKPVKVTPKAKPVAVTEDVLNFVKSYEEKLRVRGEIARLEDDYKAGKVSRAEYKSRLSTLRRRIAELDRIIENHKPSVSSAGFREELNLIEEAEADISVCDVGLSELRKRYRAGRVSRQVYERLSSEYMKRIRRSEGRIRRILASMASV